MNRAKKKHMIILSTIVIVLLLALVYYFPLQKSLAEKKYEDYSAKQGVVASDIKTKEVFKDYKQGGYFISVTYYSDPGHNYLYHYFLLDFSKTGPMYDTMYCDIYNMENDLVEHYDGVQYKPLPL